MNTILFLRRGCCRPFLPTPSLSRIVSPLAAVTALTCLIVSGLLGPPAVAQSVEQVRLNIKQGGRAVAVAVNPKDAKHAIVASESGGLFQTTDGGSKWEHVDALQPFRMADVKFAPGNPNVIIATAWGDSRRSNEGGIWRSVDGGLTWRKPETSNPPPRSGEPRCSDRAGAWGIAYEEGTNNLYVGTDCGLAVSPDLGATWVHKASELGPVWAVAASAINGGTVYTCGNSGFYRLTGRGDNIASAGWGFGECALNAPHALVVSPVEAPLHRDWLFALDHDKRLYGSEDGGATWRDMNAPGESMRPAWVRVHLSHDNNPDHIDLFVSKGLKVHRKTCFSRGGPRCSDEWEAIDAGHDDGNDLAYGPGSNCPLYLLTDGGVSTPSICPAKPHDCGLCWTLTGGARSGFNALQLYEVAGQFFDPVHTDLYIGTQDNEVYASSDNSTSWPKWVGPEGFFIQLERRPESHDQQVVTVNSPAFGNRVTAPHLENERAWNNPPVDPPPSIPDAHRPEVRNPFIIERNVYVQFAEYRLAECASPPCWTLFLTGDAGASWTPVRRLEYNIVDYRPHISGPPSNPVIYQPIRKPAGVLGLARIAGVRNVLSGRSPGVWVDADGGEPCDPGKRLVNLGQYGLGQGSFVNPPVFEVDPHDANHLIAADVGTDQMKVSHDGGCTWEVDDALTKLVTGDGEFSFHLDSGIPGASVQAHVIAFDPDNRGHIMVGTEAAGIIRSVDDGVTWAAVPGSRAITGISYFYFVGDVANPPTGPGILGRQEVKGTVYVSSYGRGLWRLRFEGNSDNYAFITVSPERSCDDPRRVCWRNPLTLDLLPSSVLREIILPPRPCPACSVVFAEGGRINDLSIDKSGLVRKVAVNDGQLRAYSLSGNEVAPEAAFQEDAAGVRCSRMPGSYKVKRRNVSFSVTGREGKYKGCPGCLSAAKRGGEIRGLLLENGRVRAVAVDFGTGRQEGVQVSARPLPPITEPYIYVSGPHPAAGNMVPPSGENVTIYGRNFCGDPGCPPAAVSIGDRLVTRELKVKADGRFTFTFSVTEPVGQYRIKVSQATRNSVLADAQVLVVPARDGR